MILRETIKGDRQISAERRSWQRCLLIDVHENQSRKSAKNPRAVVQKMLGREMNQGAEESRVEDREREM